jgi:hypothetical protein
MNGVAALVKARLASARFAQKLRRNSSRQTCRIRLALKLAATDHTTAILDLTSFV